MASRITKRVLGCFCGVGALIAPLSAFADEAFLCGPSEIVYVAPEDLELKKKTDPCIAAYFGLTVDRVSADEARREPRQSKPATAAAKANNAPVAQFKTIDLPQKNERAESDALRSAMVLRVEAAPGTDFRNVKIINAASESAQWFRHVR